MGILDDAIREHLELKRAHGADESELKQKEAEAFGPMRQEATAAAEDAEHQPATAPAEPAEAPPTEAHDVDALEPAADDPYTVHPGDDPVPDPHDHSHPVGSDPAWGDDTELFAEEPRHSETSAAAEAGAGTLEPSGHAEPGPPTAPDHHHDEQHPALRDRDAIHAEDLPPDPVFRRAESTPPDAPLEPSPVDDPPVGDPPVEHPEIDEPPPRQSAKSADGEEDVLEETPEFLQDAPEHDRLWFEQKPPRDFDFGE